MNIETNMTLGEEVLVVPLKWSESRKKKNMVVEDSAKIPFKFQHSSMQQHLKCKCIVIKSNSFIDISHWYGC